ncbi:DUF2087 domain-containing protein [Catenulispora yoronensis]|uniref:DUF2087 domain-containing protein n=1 Tax=Catenulispora yoronensis TaxID=450799 RepID=A0ABN2UPU2_9ACTN
MTPEQLAVELADPVLRRVFAAVALGASTSPEILAASGLGAPQAAPAIGRLVRAGLFVQGRGSVALDDAVLAVAGERAARRLADEAAADQPDPLLRGFLRGRVLVNLPEQDDSAYRIVLGRIAASAFTADEEFGEFFEYDERTVNDRLRPWCEGGVLDVASLRRALVDAGFLSRDSGRYRSLFS